MIKTSKSKMIDSFKHKGMRLKLVEELRGKGIVNERVLEAINSIPRHYFMDTAFLQYAYEDKAFPIGEDQTISQPFTVAFQTELLDLKKEDRVLEIGTGSGYQSAVLCEIATKVYSIERQKVLHQKSKALLRKLGYKLMCFYGDGYKGKKEYGPFDKIIITCGAPFVPQDLLAQLKVGGLMIIPVGDGKDQIMKKITRVDETNFKVKEYGMFSFVPMLKDKNNPINSL
ncbi:MAG: protein-L-isoaspartate(D-aspartate) O-methyltransferase [Patiriisocius sp.]|jgi:protein-L-isoaspartate(D-aspartate) O-methyltransferase